MIKKLRVKCIAVIMAVVTVMLMIIFGFVLHDTIRAMEQESLEAMRQFAIQGQTEDPRPGDGQGKSGPMFILEMQGGALAAIGDDWFDLSDKALLQRIYEEACADGNKTGVLQQHGLSYYRFGEGPRYVFMGVSNRLKIMERLFFTCLVVFGAAMAAFFLISLWLSGWIVRPVEKAWQQQKQFVADASHELKTPLTVILTNAELLESGEYGQEANRRFSRSILSMSRQMRGLVESMLELARMDSGKSSLPMEELDLSELVQECCLGFEPVYFEAGRELACSLAPGIRMKGNPSGLRQILDILLDNGCKYSTPGTVVEVMLRHNGRGKALLTVSSCGPVLTKQQCRDVFKRFYRADEARAMSNSYGLGLPIARQIAEFHGGRLWADGGSRNVFSLLLPIL